MFLLKANNFKLILSYFKHGSYVSYRAFNNNKTPHIYDHFISSQSLLRRIYDCKLVNFGVKSERTAVAIKFRLTAIKFANAQKD